MKHAKCIEIITALLAIDFAKSRTEGKRLIEQGSIQINGRKITEWYQRYVCSGDVIKKGRYYKRIIYEEKNKSLLSD